MPQSSRKRARSDAEGGRSDRRRSRRDDDANNDHDDSRADDSMAGPSNGGGMDVDNHAQSQNGQPSSWQLPAGYDDSNRAFLQAFMAHGALTFQQAQQVLAPILNVKNGLAATAAGASQEDFQFMSADEVTFAMLRQYINQAKSALMPLDFDIRSATNERAVSDGGGYNSNDHRVWVLVSTDNDPKSHLAVLFTPRKLAFIYRLLDALFDTYNTPRIEALCLTEQQALKLSRPPRTTARQSVGADAEGAGAGAAGADAANRDKGLKHSVVLSLLASLVRQGWLSKSAQGFYALTTRALLELEPFLVDQYNEEPAGTTTATSWQRIKYCAACRELITSGLRCATPTCTLRLHDHCEEAFWRTQARGSNTRHRCPKCEAPWGKAEEANGEVTGKLHFIGERAITSTDVYRRKKRQGRPSEGVDELMRTLQPRSATGGRGRGGGGGEGELAEPFRQAASRRREVEADGDEE
ncbi:hypothetical protein Sste5346_009615 [Sporothrix stenoceras]|uniref:Non-structural maintenance of chromosomes element 1 homolog n=1 Tax=Sporothrix stenoceras TaxID=5173 RepID=A0ABR3YJX8_9PEZI